MKTIEIKTAKQFLDEEALKLFAETWQGVASDAIINAMQAYSEQQVSIAAQKALQSCDKFLSVYTTIDYNLTSLLPQILEELKGGEGE